MNTLDILKIFRNLETANRSSNCMVSDIYSAELMSSLSLKVGRQSRNVLVTNSKYYN